MSQSGNKEISCSRLIPFLDRLVTATDGRKLQNMCVNIVVVTTNVRMFSAEHALKRFVSGIWVKTPK